MLYLSFSRKFLSVTLSVLITSVPAHARTRQSVDVEGGRGTSKVTYKDSPLLPADEIESKTVDGDIETIGISFLFFAKESYGLVPVKENTGPKKKGNALGLVLGVMGIVEGIILFPAMALLIPGLFLPSTLKLALTGRSTHVERDPEIYFGSKSHFRSVAGSLRFSAYPLATEYVSLGYFLGLEQGFIQMTHSDPQVEGEKRRVGNAVTLGFDGGLELTRSIAGTGPVLKAVYAEEHPLWKFFGSSMHAPSVMKHLSVELGWRTGF